mmetsp:Transcript_78260/g.175410  ORF Transcript_78260/g.175410 Transcript_78260/m.175410 type:complete len:892 (-) Transcript_78260:84-2759(-)
MMSQPSRAYTTMATQSTALRLDALLLALLASMAFATGMGGGCRAGSGMQGCRSEDQPTAAGSAAAMLQSRSEFYALHQGDLTADENSRGSFEGKGSEVSDTDLALEASNQAMRATREAVALGQKATEMQQLAVARRHMKNLAKMYTAHGALLRRTMHQLPSTIFAETDAKTGTPNNQLASAMSTFIDAQAASSDKCPTLLLEAKHQWNILHSHIAELAQEINITEMSVTTTTVQVDTTYEELHESEKWETKELQKCKKKHEEDYRMYYILIAELHEMQLIAAGGSSAAMAYNYTAEMAAHAQTDWSTSVTHTAEIVSTGGTTSSGGTSSSTSSGAGFTHTTTGTGPVWTPSTTTTGFAWAPPTDANGAVQAGWTPPWQPSLVQEAAEGAETATKVGTEATKASPTSVVPRAPPAAERGPPAEAARSKVADARSLVQKTKEMAQQLTACMAAEKPEEQHVEAETALLQKDAEGFPNNGGNGFGNGFGGQNGFGNGFGNGGTYGSTTTTSGFGSGNTFGATTSGSSSASGTTTGGWSTSGGSATTTGQVTTTSSTGFATSSGGLSTGMIGSSTTSTTGEYSTGEVHHSSSNYSWHSSSHSSSHSAIHTWSHSRSQHHSASHSYAYSNVINASACDYQKQILQVTYIKAYVEITRLIAEYEVLITSHTCEDWVEQTEGQVEKEYKNKIEKYTVTVTSQAQKLETYKARISKAYSVEASLRLHIQQLTTRCHGMGATVSSLDKVRDAISVIGMCPGLGKITFSLPEWTGSWVQVEVDTINLSDDDVDAALNLACEQSTANDPNQKVRAAETSEILLRSVKGMPNTNTASLPLMGPCPNCAGDNDETGGPVHFSGHARICWDPGEELAGMTRRTDCTAGRKAVLCIQETEMPTGLR